MWLAKVEESRGEAVEIDWQPLSLSQVTSEKGPEYRYWEQPEILNGSDNTLLAHQAGLAAKRQGKEAFQSFFMTLLRAHHEDKKDLKDQAVINEAAQRSGLDLARFQEDLVDPALLIELGESHTKAVEEHGAFGTPTFVFSDGQAAFLKIFVPPDEQASDMFETLSKTMREFVHVGELKRPQPPWPHGVI